MNVRHKRKRSFGGAFTVTAIMLGMLCGFTAVDLSTDRYMPGQFGSLFEISSVTVEGVDFEFLGERYFIDARALDKPLAALKEYRGLLPGSPQIVSELTRRVIYYFCE